MSEKSGSYMAETVMGGGSKRRGACGWWGKGKGLGKGSWERVLGKGLGKGSGKEGLGNVSLWVM